MITLESIQNTFSRMHEGGVNTNNPLLWGYFFTSPIPEKLNILRDELEKRALKLSEEIYQTEEGGVHWLHMEEISIHSPQTLFKRGQVFADLASQVGSINYDGYDVGNPIVGKPITDVK